MEYLGLPRSKFTDWKQSQFAVVMKGPGYYSPKWATPLWDVRTIRHGAVCEEVEWYKDQDGSEGKDTPRSASRLHFYAIDFDRRRVYYHYESGGFPAAKYIEGQ
jgi:hypothetical protein